MKSSTRTLRIVAVLAGMVAGMMPTVTQAHFKLLEPTSWLIEGDRGDPQKAGPCGGTNTDWGTPTNVVSKAVGGSKLHIKLQETVYHPGHYRVALAVNGRNELPQDPEATTENTDRGARSVSAKIMSPVKAPVLADGLFVHTAAVTTPWETDVTLPNINCKKCTLQVVQFMAEHGVNNPGGFTYHHCAELQITADSTRPLDKGWPADR
jgi:hypothetical protein